MTKGKNIRDDQEDPEEDSLDHTIEDSFPASDPPSSIPDPGEECDDDKDEKAA
jgi:hypothetical protein